MRTTVSSIRPSVAESRYLRRGIAAFEVRFPGQTFGATSWGVRHLVKSGDGSGNAWIHFTGILKEGKRNAVPDGFINMVKSYLALSGNQPGTMYNASSAARWLWEAILERLGGNGAAFSWAGFTQEDAERAEALMLASGMSPNSVYRRCIDLKSILTGLAATGVIAPVEPAYQTPRQESLDRLTLEGREARNELLPSDESINALADVYRGQFMLDPFDQLMSCVPALMFASGLRVIEVVQLTVNPIRTEGEKTFLCYFKAKGKGVVEEKIPLSTSQAVLASDAVKRAQKLTREARIRARELVRSPSEFPLPEWAMEKPWLTSQEVQDLCRIKQVARLQQHVVTQRSSGGPLLFDSKSLRSYLQRQRERISLESIRGVTKRADGTWLPLDEALFIGFRHQGHAVHGTNPLQVLLVNPQQVGGFIGGSGNGVKSVFEKNGITEKDGRFVCVNSHQIRHYVTSKASAAGISDAHLMRWQRRAHEGDLQAYKHLTTEERLRTLREHVRNGRLKGDISTMYFALAPEDREVFLETVVQAIHMTHLGLCVHDFNASPCPSAMNCVKHCGSFLFDTQDADQRRRLVTLKRRNERALQDAEAAQKAGDGVLVDEWVRELKETDEGLRVILIAEPADGASMVAPFLGLPSRFQELD